MYILVMQLMRNLMNISSQDITDFVRKDFRYPDPIGRGTGGDVRVYWAVYERFGLSNMKVRQTALPYDAMDYIL